MKKGKLKMDKKSFWWGFVVAFIVAFWISAITIFIIIKSFVS